MRTRLINLYLAATFIAALVALGLTDWSSLATLENGSVIAFGALVAMAIMSEGLAVGMSVGKGAGNTSVTFIPMLASVQLFGPAAAIILLTASTTFGEFAVRRKTFERGIFNVTQLIVAAFVGGLVFRATGGTPLQPLLDAGRPIDLFGQLLPFMLFGLVLLLLNHAAVSLAIALSQGLEFSAVWQQMLGRSGAGLQDFLISPVAIAVAFLYVQLGVLGILVAFLPLLFIRHAYLDTSRLRDANAALLKALVKAIETRDPYTSGHSVRVKELSRRIAEAMGLPRNVVKRIEDAALLHDIGKIEAPYTEILSKPESLTAEERAVIQSHVTKGEEILRNLSSFSEDVLLTVRHHHEREDGTGYPDGLAGEEIPIGARIIAVSDAVDAMLSDRPYRKALSITAVLFQLREHTGTQFSKEVVDAILSTGLIAEYSDRMRQARGAAVGGAGVGPAGDVGHSGNVRPLEAMPRVKASRTYRKPERIRRPS